MQYLHCLFGNVMHLADFIIHVVKLHFCLNSAHQVGHGFRAPANSTSVDRQEKLRRLEATKRRVPALSASALAGLLQDIEANGLPGLSGRKHVKEATVNSLDMNSYGDLIRNLHITGQDNKNTPVVYANFFTLLQGFFLQCKPFRDLLISTMQGAAARALSLCFYADEINPGNSLAVEQNRNLHIICMFCLCFAKLRHHSA